MSLAAFAPAQCKYLRGSEKDWSRPLVSVAAYLLEKSTTWRLWYGVIGALVAFVGSAEVIHWRCPPTYIIIRTLFISFIRVPFIPCYMYLLL